MKTQTRMIVASVVVIALALTAVSGITYSWFSDVEETTINVNTATLDLKLTVDDDKILNNSKSIGTGVVYDSESKTFGVTNLAANAAISIPYDLQYKASIPTVACVVATLNVDNLDSTARDHISIGYDGTSTKISDLTKENKIVLLDWKTFAKADNYTAVAADSITINTDSGWDSTTAQSFSFKIKAELYQGNFPTTELTGGTASIAGNKVVRGESGAEGKATAVPVTVDLSSAKNAESGMQLTVTSKEPSSTSGFSVGNSTVVDLSLTNEKTSVSELGGSAFITVEVVGDLTTAGAPKVAYLGDGKQPTVVSYSYDSSNNKTSITFETSHFSEFIIMKADEKVTATTADALALALAFGLNVVVNDDITFTETSETSDNNYNIGIPVGVSSKLTVEGGKKITFSKLWGFKVWGELVIDGNGTFEAASIDDAVTVGTRDPGASITINGNGTFTNVEKGSGAAYAYGGTITINGGTFNGKTDKVNGALINVQNASNGKIVINAGTFAGYDPSTGDDNHGGTFVANDKVSVKDGENYVVKTPDLTISTVTDLRNFADAVNKGETFVGKAVILAADLDLDGAEWTPIGNSIDKSFKGTFDGKNHKVSNFKVTDNKQYAGFFGYITGENCSVMNLNICKATVSSNHYAGGIVGYASTIKCINNCHVTDSEITATVENTASSGATASYDNGDKVGGIAGICSGIIEKCNVLNTKLTAYRDIGGIAGAVFTGHSLTIKGCGVDTTVTITQDLSHNYMNIAKGGKSTDSKYSGGDGMTWGDFCGNRNAWISDGSNSGKVTYNCQQVTS